MIIRLATLADYQEIKEVLQDGFNCPEFTKLDFIEYLGQDNLRCFVGIEDRKIISTYSILFEKKLLHSGGIVAHLEDFAILKEYRKRGFGKQMIDHIMNECKKRKCYKAIHTCCPELVEHYKKNSQMYVHEVSMRRDF